MRVLYSSSCSILIVAFLLCSMANSSAASDRKKPNIVMVLIDDMGYVDVGCYGSRFHETPSIDRLASEGMRFTDAYAACPVCSPTRLSIVAGKYPARVGLTDWIAGDRWPDNSPLQHSNWQMFMSPEEVTIAEALKTNGYVTATIGKWHLEANKKSPREMVPLTGPEAQGFEVLDSNPTNHTDKRVSSITDRAIDFIANNRDRPFFLYLCHYSVHTPLEATPELIRKYKKRIDRSDPQNNPIYGGMVESVDKSIGRLVTKIDELNLAENTLFVFFSDNGGLNVIEAPNTPATSNAPLRDGKGYVYEGGIRVPLIARWPGVIKPGTTCNVPISSVDFYPTFLELSGTERPQQQTLDGESIMPLLKESGTLKRNAIFWHYPHYSNQGGLPAGAMRQGDFKLVEDYHSGRSRLYNLSKDIGEKRDLSDEMPGKTNSMRSRFYAWLDSVNARVPDGNPDFDPSKPLYSRASKAPKQWRASGKALLPAKTIE